MGQRWEGEALIDLDQDGLLAELTGFSSSLGGKAGEGKEQSH